LKIEKEIGKGNFGSVFIGIWRSQKVALKSLKEESKKRRNEQRN